MPPHIDTPQPNEPEPVTPPKPDHTESTESLYDPKFLNFFPHRVISDNQLEFLKNNNIWESEEVEKRLLQLDTAPKTYDSPSHPLFSGSQTEESRSNKTVLVFSKFAENLKKYIATKDGKYKPSEQEFFHEIVLKGPYSHGNILGDLISHSEQGILMYRKIKEAELKKMPHVMGFLLESREFLYRIPQLVMIKIDSNNLSFPEFEAVYLRFLKSFYEVMPRLVTLVARDSNWDIHELEKYLEDKNIPSVQAVLAIRSDREKDNKEHELREELWKFKSPDSGEYIYTDEQKATLLALETAAADAFEAMQEYFESKVQYVEPDSEKTHKNYLV